MKTLRYLLIAMVIGLTSASVQAQVKQSKQSDKTEYQFRSTSSQVNSTSSSVMGKTTSTLMGDGSISPLMNSGSRLPIAARNGVIVGASSPDDGTSTYSIHRSKRDVGGGGGTTEDDPDPEEPEEPFPVGDGIWAMMVLAMAYVIYRVRALRRREVAEA